MRRIWPFLFFLLGFGGGILQAQPFTSVLRGIISDGTTGKPLPTATLIISGQDTSLTSVSDDQGKYRFSEVPAGRYLLEARLGGYALLSVPEVVIEAGKETVLDLQMALTLYESEGVEIKANRIDYLENAPSIQITAEETKRLPAVFMDPARVTTLYPGIVQTNDQANHIVVRGNSPNSIAWRLNGSDIVNPNHLTNAGTFTDRPAPSGGGTIIFSTQLIDDSRFLTGAFPAEFGNATGGVFDVGFRPGNNEKYEFTGQIGLIGIDLSAEGPISRRQGSSFLVNYRYSTIGLLTNLGVEVSPEAITYQDLAFNLTFPTARAGTFTFFGMGGLSSNIFEAPREDSLREESRDRFDVTYRGRMGAAGITHKIAIGSRSKLSSALVASGSDDDRFTNYIDNNGNSLPSDRDTLRQGRIQLRSIFSHRFSERITLRTGFFLSQLQYNTSASENWPLDTLGRVQLNGAQGNTQLFQPFASLQFKLGRSLTLQVGAHAQYLFLNNSLAVDPRASLGWQVAPRHRLSLAYGLHSQTQLLSTYFATTNTVGIGFNQPNRDLDFTRAHHLVLSYQYRPSPDWLIQLEPYVQSYFQVPVSASGPTAFSALNLLEEYVTEPLVNEGTGLNYGVEASVRKWLTRGYYFLVSGAWYQSKYSGSDGVQRNTRWAGNYTFGATAGKEFVTRGRKSTFGVNLRVIQNGGFRIQPIDEVASAAEGRTVFDPSQGYSEKLADYFRIDFRFYWKRQRRGYTHTLGFDIQNLTNQQNPAFRYYDFVQGQVVTRFQLGIIPLLDFRVQF